MVRERLKYFSRGLLTHSRISSMSAASTLIPVVGSSMDSQAHGFAFLVTRGGVEWRMARNRGPGGLGGTARNGDGHPVENAGIAGKGV
jgi:hypothetical protein